MKTGISNRFFIKTVIIAADRTISIRINLRRVLSKDNLEFIYYRRNQKLVNIKNIKLMLYRKTFNIIIYILVFLTRKSSRIKETLWRISNNSIYLYTIFV